MFPDRVVGEMSLYDLLNEGSEEANPESEIRLGNGP